MSYKSRITELAPMFLVGLWCDWPKRQWVCVRWVRCDRFGFEIEVSVQPWGFDVISINGFAGFFRRWVGGRKWLSAAGDLSLFPLFFSTVTIGRT